MDEVFPSKYLSDEFLGLPQPLKPTVVKVGQLQDTKVSYAMLCTCLNKHEVTAFKLAFVVVNVHFKQAIWPKPLQSSRRGKSLKQIVLSF